MKTQIKLTMVLATVTACSASSPPAGTGPGAVRETVSSTAKSPQSLGRCPESVATAPVATAVASAALAAEASPEAVTAWLQSLPRVRGMYLVEGDLLLTEAEARAHLTARRTVPDGGDSASLLVNVEGGKDTIWPASARTLTYGVDRSTFPDPGEYAEVVQQFARAARQWVLACPDCGVDFVHDAEADVDLDASKVTFVVKKDDDPDSPYLALAFFPSWPTSRHVVWVGPKYFQTSYDHTGVFRHEIGHILGYRHEHIRDVAGCYAEDGEYRAITCYDPKSVMHYYCGGAGSRTFELSSLDIEGHRRVYGP